MKKLSNLLVFTFLSLFVFAADLQAQTTPSQAKTASVPVQTSPADYFVGTWNVKVSGLPDGDKDMVVLFEKKDGKLAGGIVDAATKKVNPFTSVTQTDNKVSASFMNEEPNMEISLSLEKKDDTKITGSLMDMFTMEGSRAK